MAEETGTGASVSAGKSIENSSSASSFKVYTRTGDGGSSCLFNMERRDKDDVIFEALGEVDEVGVALGAAKVWVDELWRLGRCDGEDEIDEVIEEHFDCSSEIDGLTYRQALEPLSNRITEIQSRLMDVGSAVATPLDNAPEHKKQRVNFEDKHVDTLEQWIDEYDEHLPPLKNFILPGGNKPAAFLHLARTAARRAERRVVPLARDELIDQVIVKYLNRLSDFLYTAARFVVVVDGSQETIYCKAKYMD